MGPLTSGFDRCRIVEQSGPLHPQYVGGIVFVIGWFIVAGGIHALATLPVIVVCIGLQAMIEQRYILEPEFGKAYRDYARQVGAFVPRGRR